MIIIIILQEHVNVTSIYVLQQNELKAKMQPTILD